MLTMDLKSLNKVSPMDLLLLSSLEILSSLTQNKTFSSRFRDLFLSSPIYLESLILRLHLLILSRVISLDKKKS